MAKSKKTPDPSFSDHSPSKDLRFVQQVIGIYGVKVASFRFDNVPSVNTHYQKHRIPRGHATGEWRLEAKEKALDFICLDITPLIKKRAFVVVRVYIPHEGIMDVHNTHIKPLLDGFSDAGIWADDEWAWVPLVITHWAGVTPGKRGIEIDVYELDMMTVGQHPITLPSGRTRNGNANNTNNSTKRSDPKRSRTKMRSVSNKGR